MRKPPPDPWIQFPNSLGDAHKPPEAMQQLTDWLNFMRALSRDELLRRERDHPPPPGWEKLYKIAAQWHDKRLEGGAWIDDLIAQMWQSTTLK